MGLLALAVLIQGAAWAGLALDRAPAVAFAGNAGGGFVTCCCLRLEPSGRGTAANAGQLAPCLDGREIETESGLPLGIVPDATYAESSFRLEPGGRVTLVSDGVVETADARRELFGFDRTRPRSIPSRRRAGLSANGSMRG